MLPRGKGSAEQESWRQAVAEHPAWDCVAGPGENAELRRANEILKAASVFFAAELDRPLH